MLGPTGRTIEMKWKPIETWKPKSWAKWPYFHAIVYADGVVEEAYWKPGDTSPETGDWWPVNMDSEYSDIIYPTHWMHLPKPPKGGT